MRQEKSFQKGRAQRMLLKVKDTIDPMWVIGFFKEVKTGKKKEHNHDMLRLRKGKRPV